MLIKTQPPKTRSICMTTETLYPLLTERRIVTPIWGGKRLAEWLHLPEPRPTQLGETWQVFDANVITNGALEGQTLAQVAQQYGTQLVGTRTIDRYGADFPLLAKFLDAGERLSIQVHPDDAYAHSHAPETGFHGKTEAWYILDAAPGASVIHGLKRPSNRAEFAQAVRDEALEPMLQRIPVKKGDVILVPAGTLHAIEAGIMLFEIQEKSDLTYRVYDYGRRDPKTGQPRTLHLEDALAVCRFGPSPTPKMTPLPLEPDVRTLLVACPFFALEHWNLRAARSFTIAPESFEILTVVAGEVTVSWDDGAVTLKCGESVVLPAALYGGCTIQNDPKMGPGQVLRAYVPDLERDLIVPLQERGFDNEQIAQVVINL